jgi:hypothetical protein
LSSAVIFSPVRLDYYIIRTFDVLVLLIQVEGKLVTGKLALRQVASWFGVLKRMIKY